MVKSYWGFWCYCLTIASHVVLVVDDEHDNEQQQQQMKQQQQNHLTQNEQLLTWSDNNNNNNHYQPPSQSSNSKRKKARNLTVKTNYGYVQGFRQLVNLSRDRTLKQKIATVNTWLGIPFAEPPVGNRRFKYPIPKQPWKGVLETKKVQLSCYHQQIEFYHIVDEQMWLPEDVMSEDCLYLNIWTPDIQTSSTTQIPVMVWIFGGGFMTGSATLPLYDGKVLSALNNVIVVSAQYRLGLFGFMYFGNSLCPGNMGLMDQSLALKWVSENIQYFGGDQTRITIFGESSGAVSVGLHILSPFSQPYFHRAIMQSGSPTADWGVISAKVALRRTKRMLRSVSFFELVKEIIREKYDTEERIQVELKKADYVFGSRDYKSLFSYLLNAPIHPRNQTWDGMWSAIELTVWSGTVGYAFVPVVDKNFIPNAPEILLKQGRFKRVPLIAGTNRDEGTYFNAYISTAHKINLSSSVPVFPHHTFIRTLLEESVFTNFPIEPWKSPAIVYDSIYAKYVRMEAPLNDTVNALQISRAAGDFHFSCPTIKFSEYLSNTNNYAPSPVYFYFFNHCLSYRGQSSQAWPKWMGVLHADEILFIFGDPFLSSVREYTNEEIKLSRTMMTYWTNFAKTGNPNPNEVEWPRYTYPSRVHIEIAAGNVSKGASLKVNDCFFWDYYMPQLLVAVGRCEKLKSSSTSSWKNALQEGANKIALATASLLVYIVI